MRPHVVFLLADDLGWANIGYNRNATPEVVTPNLDALVKIGVDLQR
jgi:arylsulfatase A-like enzyme|tara:strand:- start:240 stop:377 length:138 start_codon:yes stop_codon:yes gene_type:complete